ncbi:MAG: sulfotransferase, partial [Planctomycetes bacterium]|nr:sulfotransferase [Planctomycetota bacterium]
SEEQLDTVDIAGLRADMGMMERVGKNPLLFKAVPLSLNIDFLAEHCPKAKFIYLERDLLYIAQSTYQARMDRYGDARQWWSLKPAEYEQLRQKKPLQQIVGQIHCCSRRLLHCLEKIPPEKRLHLTYKGLCESPRQKLECIAEFMGRTCDNNAVPESFSHRNVRQLDTDLFCKLQGYFDGDEFQT